jgi:hypothetical protein
MRLSELLGDEVYDADGAKLGLVVDALAVQDGPPAPGGLDQSLRLAGLVVGRAGLGVRLGFHRAGVKGPWPMRVVMERFDRRCRFVAWDQVASWNDGRIDVRGRASDYGSPPVVEARGGGA